MRLLKKPLVLFGQKMLGSHLSSFWKRDKTLKVKKSMQASDGWFGEVKFGKKVNLAGQTKK